MSQRQQRPASLFNDSSIYTRDGDSDEEAKPGAPNEEVDGLCESLKKTCRTRRRRSSSEPPEGEASDDYELDSFCVADDDSVEQGEEIDQSYVEENAEESGLLSPEASPAPVTPPAPSSQRKLRVAALAASVGRTPGNALTSTFTLSVSASRINKLEMDVLFLESLNCSDDAAFVTGVVLPVDGGYLLTG